jgi:hypothetical protein
VWGCPLDLPEKQGSSVGDQCRQAAQIVNQGVVARRSCRRYSTWTYHVTHILDELGLSRRSGASAYAAKPGLLDRYFS